MSGHSKWSTIKRKKAAEDAKRGKVFTKIIKEIQIAAKLEGGDEETNPRLRNAIQAAKDANMPKDNIERAIKKGTGELEGVNYEEHTYEAYGPGGVAILLEILTDNKNRTVSEIRHIMDKHGGKLATNGSVAWMFDPKGKIFVEQDKCPEDDAFLAASDAGAEDFSVEDNLYEISTDPKELHDVRERLEADNIPISESILDMVPQSTVKVERELAPKIIALMEDLEDHEDVQKVFSNFDIDDEILAELQD